MQKFDYGIIGGGPAGYTAGMLLAKQGKSVVLFEKDKLGGTCLNCGCIPTKALLHSSDIYSQLKRSYSNGIITENLSFDFAKVVERKNSIVEKLRKSLELTVKNSGVKTIYATAKIKNSNTIVADDEEFIVNEIIIATGSKPREIKGLEFDGKFILNSNDVLNLTVLPKSVLIVGSGAIGIEWARIFSNFDVEVNIVEMAEHLIPLADIEVSKRIERIFKQNKIKYYTNDCIEKVENKIAILKSGERIQPDFILVAVGRVPLKNDLICKTIIGDACGEMQLAHYAAQQAKEIALGITCNKENIPSIIYGEPEIAWVGMREQDMDARCKKVMLPISALGKAWCDDAIDGFLKIITKDDVIVGSHIVSKEASSLIHILLLAIQQKIKLQDLKNLCFAHPTYSEGIGELLMNI